MDAAPLLSPGLSAASRWSGHASPHELAEALSLILPLLPLDARACTACVCRAWRAATLHPALWEELSFERCTALFNDEALASLCARAGAALRTLDLNVDACALVTAEGMLAALRCGGCTGVQRLSTRHDHKQEAWECMLGVLTAEQVQQLSTACPRLTHAACSVDCRLSDAAAVLTALPGPLKLRCNRNHRRHNASFPAHLAECLRVNTTLTSLHLGGNMVGAAGVALLATALRTNTALTNLNLEGSYIVEAGVVQLAECLCVNTTLRHLDLSSNFISPNSEAGMRSLAGCLRANATLTSLRLKANDIDVAGATHLADGLRENRSVSRLDLSDNRIGDAGLTQLAECLRVNATLTSLDLSGNRIGATGATLLAEALRVNATLKMLYLSDNEIGGAGATQLSACVSTTRSRAWIWMTTASMQPAR